MASPGSESAVKASGPLGCSVLLTIGCPALVFVSANKKSPTGCGSQTLEQDRELNKMHFFSLQSVRSVVFCYQQQKMDQDMPDRHPPHSYHLPLVRGEIHRL